MLATVLLPPVACMAAAAPFYAAGFERQPSAAELTAIGKVLFFDPSLSASGKAACATCHDPKYAFAQSNDHSVQRAGADGRQAGVRAVPSLMYAQNVPPFTEHFVDDEGDDSIDQGPAGGRTWDGRAESAHSQARLPLLSPFEMANADEAAVAAKLRRAAYAPQMVAAFGTHLFSDRERTLNAALLALETYQQNPAEFYPYSSKYDAWLRGEAELSPQERLGLAAFNDPRRGNCARCHPSARRQGALPQFTDYGYAAIGVPRNPRIPANADRRYFDLGLCGPWREDLAGREEYCGMFRTPTLRNVATRRVFFHNGVLHSLQDAVRFYAQRDSQPQRWYPVHAAVRDFDDLPAAYWANLDGEAPFDPQLEHAQREGVTSRREGATSRRERVASMSDADIADIVAFLRTLTDGYATVPDTTTPKPPRVR